MSTTVKTGWLNDKNGDKFAPKTLASQVQTSDGTLFEDKIQADVDSKFDNLNTALQNGEIVVFEAINAENAAKAEVAEKDGDSNIISDTYETKVNATAKLTEAKSYTDESVTSLGNNFETVIKQMYADDFDDAPTIREIANDESNTALNSANTYTDNAVAQKTQVQIITWGVDD